MKCNLGYTLLEMLVVLVIISIMTTVAVLTMGHQQERPLKTFTETLIESLTLAEEQAILQPATVALIFTAHDFGFYEYQQGWKPIIDDALSRQSLPPGIQVQLDKPVVINSDGKLSDFRLRVSNQGKNRGFEIRGHIDGTITSYPYYPSRDHKGAVR